MPEEVYGQEATERAMGFEPLLEPEPAYVRPDQEEYSGDEGLRRAANDLAGERASAENNPPTIDRKYFTVGGEKHGEEVEAHKTIELDRAASDLAGLRADEARSQQEAEAQSLAEAIDGVRSAVLNGEYERQREQTATQGTQPEAQQPSQPPVQPEASAQELPPGSDPELQAALQNPKIRAALAAEAAATDAMRNNYVQAATQAAQVAAAALYTNFPEIAGIHPNALPTAMQVLAHQNPQRYAQLHSYIENVRSLHGASIQAQRAEQQKAAARWDKFVSEQDAAFETAMSTEPPEIVKQVKESIRDIAQEKYGLSAEHLAHYFKTEPLMRTAAFQMMMYDAARFHIAQRGLQERAPAAVPQVQRPGTARETPSRHDYAIDEARAEFARNPTPRNGAALLRARRSA